ncbi:MAG: helix-turn-helix domain-containing protein [bacterium]
MAPIQDLDFELAFFMRFMAFMVKTNNPINLELLDQIMPEACAGRLGAKAKALRLAAGWKRTTLAERAGVSAASLKRFEQTGLASLELVLRVALSLGRLAEFDGLLEPSPARSIDELEQRLARPLPKLGVR